MTYAEPVRCDACGHYGFLHRANTEDQRRKFDQPVPCFAAVDRHVVATPEGRAVEWRYDYCGCTAAINQEANR